MCFPWLGLERLLLDQLSDSQRRRYVDLLMHKKISQHRYTQLSVVVEFGGGEDSIEFLRTLLPEVRQLIQGNAGARATRNSEYLARLC